MKKQAIPENTHDSPQEGPEGPMDDAPTSIITFKAVCEGSELKRIVVHVLVEPPV